MLLGNLLPVYEELERGLERHRGSSIFAGVSWTSLYRSAVLEHDLRNLAGADWRRSVSLLPSGQSYVRQVQHAAADNGERLIAHAYTRYLGDLSGGQVIKRLLGNSLGLGQEGLSFYDFPEIGDVAGFKSMFRTSVDAAATGMVDAGSVVEEAATAFKFNIKLSNEVEAALAGC